FGEADDAEFFDERRVLVEFFYLVWVDVLSVRVNDDLFRASDEVEVAFVVESSEVARVEPAADECALCRLLVAVVAEHDVWAARDDLADAGRVGFGDANLDAGQSLADARSVKGVLRARHGQNGRGFGQSVAFEYGKAQSVHVALDLLVERGAAADEVAYLTAEACVNRAEDYLAEVEGRLVAQPTVEAHQGLRGIADPLAVVAQSRHDAAVQKLPKRGNADHARYVSVLDCAREFFAVEFGE